MKNKTAFSLSRLAFGAVLVSGIFCGCANTQATPESEYYSSEFLVPLCPGATDIEFEVNYNNMKTVVFNCKSSPSKIIEFYKKEYRKSGYPSVDPPPPVDVEEKLAVGNADKNFPTADPNPGYDLRFEKEPSTDPAFMLVISPAKANLNTETTLKVHLTRFGNGKLKTMRRVTNKMNPAT